LVPEKRHACVQPSAETVHGSLAERLVELVAIPL
jgi:hypothetical protein